MTGFFRSSTTWVIDFRYEGRPRRWFKIFSQGIDPTETVREQLHALYGDRARLEAVRVATVDEETQFLRGEEAKNVYCPTGRRY